MEESYCQCNANNVGPQIPPYLLSQMKFQDAHLIHCNNLFKPCTCNDIANFVKNVISVNINKDNVLSLILGNDIARSHYMSIHVSYCADNI